MGTGLLSIPSLCGAFQLPIGRLRAIWSCAATHELENPLCCRMRLGESPVRSPPVRSFQYWGSRRNHFDRWLGFSVEFVVELLDLSLGSGDCKVALFAQDFDELIGIAIQK